MYLDRREIKCLRGKKMTFVICASHRTFDTSVQVNLPDTPRFPCGLFNSYLATNVSNSFSQPAIVFL